MTGLSMTARFVGLALLLVLLLAGGGGLALWQQAGAALRTQDLTRLRGDFELVHNATRVWVDGEIWTDIDTRALPRFAPGGGLRYAVYDLAGDLISASDPGEEGLPAPLPGAAGEDSTGEVALSRISGPDGAPAWLAFARVPIAPGWDEAEISDPVPPEVLRTEALIVVQRDGAPAGLSDLRRAVLAGALVGLAALLAGLWLIARFVLSPLRHPDRDHPERAPPELRPLLSALRDQALSERRFAGDAAHELRTPVAELRTLTDVALAFPEDEAHLRDTLQQANEISRRLGAMTAALLGTARRGQAAQEVSLSPTDIPALLRASLRQSEGLARQRRLTIRADLPDSPLYDSDPALLRSVLDNLIGNAVAHAPEGSMVQIVYSGGSTGWRLDLSNDAPLLRPEDLTAMFRPFWRKSGGGAVTHSGLGLALARSFAEALDLDLRAHLLGGPRLQMTLSGQKEHQPPKA